jgi:hypothetical protein
LDPLTEFLGIPDIMIEFVGVPMENILGVIVVYDYIDYAPFA